jgi:hypothetical protein
MTARGKVLAAVLGIGVPGALIAVDVVLFSSNPLGFIGAVTWLLGGCVYLVSYQDHE